MARNTSVTLGEHFEKFIARQIKSGRFESKSEVVRAGMRLLEEHERKVTSLRQALVDGETSGDSLPYVIGDLLEEARRESGIKPTDA